jgi:hypothetical protein
VDARSPFGGKAVPAAVFYYSATREGEYAERQLAQYTGIVQADAYSGFNGLFVASRQPGGASSYKAAPKGPPSSLVQHDASHRRLHDTMPISAITPAAALRVCGTAGAGAGGPGRWRRGRRGAGQ